MAERAYSRKLEKEADAVGLEIMATAGYDPRSMLDLWELMACVDADAEARGRTKAMDKVALLRTHPTSEERQQALTDKLPKAMGLMQEAREKRQPKRASIEEVIRKARESEKVAAQAVVEIEEKQPQAPAAEEKRI